MKTQITVNEELNQKLSNCQQLFCENEDRISHLVQNGNALQSELGTSTNLVSALEEKVKTLELSLANVQSKEASSLDELDEARGMIDQMAQEKEDIRVKLSDNLRKITLAMEEEEKGLRQQMGEKEEELCHAKSRIADLESMIEAGKSLMTRKNEESVQVAKEMEGKHIEMERLSVTCDKLQLKIGTICFVFRILIES